MQRMRRSTKQSQNREVFNFISEVVISFAALWLLCWLLLDVWR